MNRIVAALLGPELLWIAYFFVCRALAGRNEPPTPAGNALLERCTTLGAFIGVALTFIVFAVPGTSRWALLARLAVAVCIGINICLFQIIDGIDYQDSRNSGALGFWVYGILMGGLALIPGLIAAALLIRRAA